MVNWLIFWIMYDPGTLASVVMRSASGRFHAWSVVWKGPPRAYHLRRR